jgi:hypothetical protein
VLSYFPNLYLLKDLDLINKTNNNNNIDTKLVKDTLIDNTSWFSIIGLILLGAGTIIGLICVGDYFIPSIVREIPGVGTLLDSIYSVSNNIISWVSSNNNSNPPKSPEAINIPETISRSSSGSSSSSTSTITPPTPPVSRTSTPMPPIGMFWD